jgi:hypothetical protein
LRSPARRRISQSGALPGTVKDCAIVAFIGLHGKKNVFKILKKRISAGVSFTPSICPAQFFKKKLIRFSRRVFAQLAKKWYSAT